MGSVLLDNSLWDEVAESLTVDDLFLDAHRRIFTHMTTLVEIGYPIDSLTLSESLTNSNELEAAGGVSYLSSLMDGAIERTTLKPYLDTIRKKSVMRGIYQMAAAAMEEALADNEAPESLLAKIESFVLEVSDQTADSKFSTLRDAVEDRGGIDGYINGLLDPVAMSGISTGYPKLDKITGGLPKKNLILIAARPGAGKTALAGNLIENILLAESKAVIAFFSLEMSKEAVLSRLLASVARVSVREVRSGGFVTTQGRERLMDALAALIEKGLYVDDSSYLTPIRMRSKCRQLKRRKGRLDLVAVDYLQLMGGGAKFENREKEVSAVGRSLKALAKELDVPVVALSQLSRNVEGRADKTPMLSDLRESGSL